MWHVHRTPPRVAFVPGRSSRFCFGQACSCFPVFVKKGKGGVGGGGLHGNLRSSFVMSRMYA